MSSLKTMTSISSKLGGVVLKEDFQFMGESNSWSLNAAPYMVSREQGASVILDTANMKLDCMLTPKPRPHHDHTHSERVRQVG